MTIGLIYDDTLSRVQIALSDLSDGTVQVQRVANAAATEALWARGVVRGGSALPIDGGVGTLDDFEFFADVQNHYRVVPVDPGAGLLLDGTAGGYASTPDDSALDITGNIDLQAEISPDEWVSGADQEIQAKYETGTADRSYRMFLNATGQLSVGWSTDGLAFSSIGKTLPAQPARLAVRINIDVDDGAGQHVVRFWTAPSVDGPWELFAIETLAGTTSIHAGTAALTVGARGNTGAVAPFAGVIHRTRLYDGFQDFGGVLVADPDFSGQPHGTTSFTDAAGRPWTVNGAAQIIGIETASITPSLDGRVWLKSIRYPALNRPLPRVLDRGQDIRRTGRDATMLIAGRTTPVGATEHRTAPTFTIHVKTSDVEQAGELDVILAAGGVFFVHVPATSKLPGGYVLFVGDTAQQQSTVADEFMFVLPCQVVAPPAPQITGTLLTAETVFRLYGDANALYAAHSTGRSLLATIADPSDPVVI